MIYYGNEREDGRIILPHELVYKDATLDCLTGLVTLPDKEFTIKPDDSPIDFVIEFTDTHIDLGKSGNNPIIFVMYDGYTKLYKDDKIFEVDDLGVYLPFRNIHGTIQDDGLHFELYDRKYIWGDYKQKCRQLLEVHPNMFDNKDPEYIYIGYKNVIGAECDILLDRFMLIEAELSSFIYDTHKNILQRSDAGMTRCIKSSCENIKDIIVYRDTVEIYTDNGNYYIEKCNYFDSFNKLPDGWSVKPRFTVSCKSAKKID